ncbi:MAG: hypothetical protein FWH42_04360 [Dehalococcoidia bacterium]|nr:hypothetical protein [Dehalococcoidia bacterium]
MIRELLGREELPKMDTRKKESKPLVSDRKAGYIDYRSAQKEMREIVVVKGNIDHLFIISGCEKDR